MKTSFFSIDNKKYILLFPLSVLIGAVFINLAGINKINEWGFFSTINSEKNTLITVSKYVFSERIVHFIIVFLMCFSTIKDKLFSVFIGWLGFSLGIVEGALILQFGLEGILYFIVLVCIHNVIYFFSTMGLLAFSEQKEKEKPVVSIAFIIVSYLLGYVVEVFLAYFFAPLIKVLL